MEKYGTFSMTFAMLYGICDTVWVLPCHCSFDFGIAGHRFLFFGTRSGDKSLSSSFSHNKNRYFQCDKAKSETTSFLDHHTRDLKKVVFLDFNENTDFRQIGIIKSPIKKVLHRIPLLNLKILRCLFAGYRHV